MMNTEYDTLWWIVTLHNLIQVSDALSIRRHIIWLLRWVGRRQSGRFDALTACVEHLIDEKYFFLTEYCTACSKNE
jgi:hypothetical protein